MNNRFKELHAAIADEIDHPRGTTRLSRAKRVMNVMNGYLEELSVEAYVIGRETDDWDELERRLKIQGMLPSSCKILTARFEKILERYE